MKTKLEMAHDYAMLHMMMDRYKDVDDLEMVQWANDYVDALESDADKRKVSGVPDELQQEFINGVEQTRYAPPCDDWQPDWSQAPDGVTSWHMNENKSSYWVIGSGVHLFEDQGKFLADEWHSRPAPSFDYKGDWKESLRKRPV